MPIRPFLSFIEEADRVHNSRYTYSKDSYFGTNKPVIVSCPDHGDFSIYGSNHLKGQGCRDCLIAQGGKRRKYSKDEFVKKLKDVYGEELTLTETDYDHRQPEVRCKIHGVFSKPTGALIERKQGCKECSYASRRVSAKDFFERAQARHGSRWSYDLDSYKGLRQPITVICSEHGRFTVTALTHLNTLGGCKHCTRKEQPRGRSYSEFVEVANEVHDSKYSYLENEWDQTSDRVTVVCKSHGSFTQRKSKHIHGNGCPACGRYLSYGVQKIASYLKSKDIRFELEKTFGLKGAGGGSLRFDFYLPDLHAVIEYDGLQHAQPVRFNSRSDPDREFRRTQENDQIKNEWANTNSVPLLRVSHRQDPIELTQNFIRALKS